MPDKPPDFLDAAIAAVAQKEGPQPVDLVNVNIKIMGREDRPAAMSIPKDITDMELLGLVAAVLQIGDELRKFRKPAIEIARQMPNGPVS